MTKRFTPKFPRAVGRIVHLELTPEQLVDLFTNDNYLYEGQRNHGDNAAKRKHTHGELTGPSQEFAGVYCEEIKAYRNMDGYHRSAAVAIGDAHFPKGYKPVLTVHRVKTVAEMDAMYDKYNSALAAKKSKCYFESGMRDAKLLGKLTSLWVIGWGRAQAVQMAAGMTGTVKTRAAVVKMKKGLTFCDKLGLPRTPHVIAGAKGALIAIAQYSPDAEAAESFIKAVCDERYEPVIKTSKTRIITTLRKAMQTKSFGTTGGTPNALTFNACLSAFRRYVYVSNFRAMPKEVDMSLAVFMSEMEAFKATGSRSI